MKVEFPSAPLRSLPLRSPPLLSHVPIFSIFRTTIHHLLNYQHRSFQTHSINIIVPAIKMIANKDSLTKAANDTGLHEPVRFKWRVTGYFTPDLLDHHVDRLARATQKRLKTCHWPAKEFQYGAVTVEPMALCSREERKKASLDKHGRAYLAMTVCESHVSVVFWESNLTISITGPDNRSSQTRTHLCSTECARSAPDAR